MKPLLIDQLFLQGCAVTKQLVPTCGSRADGTITLAFEYGIFEVPQLDAQQGLNTAKQRCAGWSVCPTNAQDLPVNLKNNMKTPQDCVPGVTSGLFLFITLEYSQHSWETE